MLKITGTALPMEHFKRRIIGEKYFQIELFEYSKDILSLAGSLGAHNVSIENFYHYGRSLGEFNFGLTYKGQAVETTLKRFTIDFVIKQNGFLQLEDIWWEQGCNAIFHDAPEIKFKANDLPELQRYHALENFSWNLELIIPGTGSDGIAMITSPKEELIDTIEQSLKPAHPK